MTFVYKELCMKILIHRNLGFIYSGLNFILHENIIIHLLLQVGSGSGAGTSKSSNPDPRHLFYVYMKQVYIYIYNYILLYIDIDEILGNFILKLCLGRIRIQLGKNQGSKP